MIFRASLIREISVSKEQKNYVIIIISRYIIVAKCTMDDAMEYNSTVVIMKAIFAIAKTGCSGGRCLQRCSNRDSSIAKLVVVAAMVVVESDDRSFQECQILKYRRLSRSAYQDSHCAALRPTPYAL